MTVRRRPSSDRLVYSALAVAGMATLVLGVSLVFLPAGLIVAGLAIGGLGLIGLGMRSR